MSKCYNRRYEKYYQLNQLMLLDRSSSSSSPSSHLFPHFFYFLIYVFVFPMNPTPSLSMVSEPSFFLRWALTFNQTLWQPLNPVIFFVRCTKGWQNCCNIWRIQKECNPKRWRIQIRSLNHWSVSQLCRFMLWWTEKKIKQKLLRLHQKLKDLGLRNETTKTRKKNMERRPSYFTHAWIQSWSPRLFLGVKTNGRKQRDDWERRSSKKDAAMATCLANCGMHFSSPLYENHINRFQFLHYKHGQEALPQMSLGRRKFWSSIRSTSWEMSRFLRDMWNMSIWETHNFLWEKIARWWCTTQRRRYLRNLLPMLLSP